MIIWNSGNYIIKLTFLSRRTVKRYVFNFLLPCVIGDVGTAGLWTCGIGPGPGLGWGPKPPTMLLKIEFSWDIYCSIEYLYLVFYIINSCNLTVMEEKNTLFYMDDVKLIYRATIYHVFKDILKHQYSYNNS